jgi:hypothetical protein
MFYLRPLLLVFQRPNLQVKLSLNDPKYDPIQLTLIQSVYHICLLHTIRYCLQICSLQHLAPFCEERRSFNISTSRSFIGYLLYRSFPREAASLRCWS